MINLICSIVARDVRDANIYALRARLTLGSKEQFNKYFDL
jgi:hypothetical protein